MFRPEECTGERRAMIERYLPLRVGPPTPHCREGGEAAYRETMVTLGRWVRVLMWLADSRPPTFGALWHTVQLATTFSSHERICAAVDMLGPGHYGVWLIQEDGTIVIDDAAAARLERYLRYGQSEVTA